MSRGVCAQIRANSVRRALSVVKTREFAGISRPNMRTDEQGRAEAFETVISFWNMMGRAVRNRMRAALRDDVLRDASTLCRTNVETGGGLIG
jgi:hypothetical protein